MPRTVPMLMFTRTGPHAIGLVVRSTTPTLAIKWFTRTLCIVLTGTLQQYLEAILPGPASVHATAVPAPVLLPAARAHLQAALHHPATRLATAHLQAAPLQAALPQAAPLRAVVSVKKYVAGMARAFTLCVRTPVAGVGKTTKAVSVVKRAKVKMAVMAVS